MNVLLDTAIRCPELRQLHEFWKLKAAGALMPARSDFDVQELKPWLPHLMLLDVVSPAAFQYRVYGTALGVLFGHDHTGKSTDVLDTPVREAVVPLYAEALRNARPVAVVLPRRVYLSMLRVDRQVSDVEKLILPLGSGDRPTQLLVGVYPV